MFYAWRYAKYNKMKMREGEKTPGLVEFMNCMYGRTVDDGYFCYNYSARYSTMNHVAMCACALASVEWTS